MLTLIHSRGLTFIKGRLYFKIIMTDGALHFNYTEGKVATVKPNFTPNFLGLTVACKVATFCIPRHPCSL